MNWAAVDTCADNDATCYVPPKAARIACASSGSEMYVFGGYRGEYMNTVSVFDSELLSWRPTTPVGERPHGRQGATLTRLGDRFVLFGGASASGHPQRQSPRRTRSCPQDLRHGARRRQDRARVKDASKVFGRSGASGADFPRH